MAAACQQVLPPLGPVDVDPNANVATSSSYVDTDPYGNMPFDNNDWTGSGTGFNGFATDGNVAETWAGSGDGTGAALPGENCAMYASSVITSFATAAASSVFNGQVNGVQMTFPADLAKDGNVSTSWFSNGDASNLSDASGADEKLSLIFQQDHCFDAIAVNDNSQNLDASWRTNFGFATVEIQVRNALDEVVWTSGSRGYPGVNAQLNPSIVDPGGIVGRRVDVLLRGHENADCGGVSEVRIEGRPDFAAP